MSDTNQPTVGNVGAAVAAKHASGDPQAQIGRYQYDFDSGGVVLTQAANEPPVLRTIGFTEESRADGSTQLVAHIPQLAVGTAGMGGLGPYAAETMYDAAFSPLDPMGIGPWDPATFGGWDNFLTNSDGKLVMRKAIRAYLRDPLVYKCTKFLAQMSNTRINRSCANPKTLEMFDQWLAQAMPDSFRMQFFVELIRTGMVPVLKTLIPYRPRDLKKNKIPKPDDNGDNINAVVHAKAELEREEDECRRRTEELLLQNAKAEAEYVEASRQYDEQSKMHALGMCSTERLEVYAKALAVKQYTWVRGQIAGSYTILNPLFVDIDGPEEMSWLREPYLRISGTLQQAVQNPSAPQAEMLAKMPREIVSQIKRGVQRIWLSPNVCTVCFKDKMPYERYPTPMISHAFSALEMKEDLYAMDRSTVKGVKNRILLVKVGNDTFPVFDPAKINDVARVFNATSRTATLFWNHTIELEWVEPKLDSLKDEKKYHHWDNQIRTVYGVSPVLTGTSESTGAIGNSIMNFKGVEQEVKELQKIFLEFLRKEIVLFRAALGLSDEITVEFDELNLKDEVKFWAVLTQAVMNGIIDHQTALETLNFHFPTIVQRMQDMKQFKDKGLFMPIPSANNLGPGGTPLPAKGGTPGGPQGGKPANSPLADNNANKKGTSQPKMKAAARIMPVNDEEFRIVLASDDVGPEHRQDVADEFGIPAEWVVTKAEYEAKHGEIDFTPALPSLTVPEIMAAIEAVPLMQLHAKSIAEDLTAEARKATPRGPLPKGVAEEIQGRAVTRACAAFVETCLGEGATLPKHWDRYVSQAEAEIAGQVKDAAKARMQAVAMCAHRAKKAANNTPVTA